MPTQPSCLSCCNLSGANRIVFVRKAAITNIQAWLDLLHECFMQVAEIIENQSIVVLRPKPEALAKAAAGQKLKTDFGRRTL